MKKNMNYPLNIQLFAAENGTTISTDFAKPQSIDFVHQFNGGITKLLEVLGVTRRIPMAVGSIIKFYTADVDVKHDAVAEGDLIPLSKITTKSAGQKELTFNKYRKLVTGEAIQRNGYDQAISQQDVRLVKEIQKRVRKDWFDNLAKGTGVKTAANPGLQGALAAAWGAVQTVFEDDGVNTLVFVNPLDVENYIGGANVTTQTAFGLTFITGFTNVTIITNTNVPSGSIYATAPDNIVMAYAVVSGELNRAFSLTTDETGLVGITHYPANDKFSFETMAVDAIELFAERLDGVFKIDIVAPVDAAVGAVATGVAGKYIVGSLEDMTNAELKSLCDLLGITYGSKVNKDQLLALLKPEDNSDTLEENGTTDPEVE